MFAGSMRGPRMKTPLLLLLLLLTTLTGTVICQDEDEGADADTEATEEEAVEEEDVEVKTEPPESEATTAPDDSVTTAILNTDDEGCGSANEIYDPELDINGTDCYEEPGDTEGLGLILILVPVVLVALIIGVIVCCIVISRRWNQKARNQDLRKEDPYLDGSSTEKVPMPMFEEDVPSVLELEMEDFDQWMKKDDEPAEDSLHS